jgi:hypothetical protein
MIREHDVVRGLKCCKCGTEEEVTCDEDGNEICFDCLFMVQCDARQGAEEWM